MKKEKLKLLLISIAVGLVVGVLAAFFLDLNVMCNFGLISYVPNCTNPVIFVLLMVGTATIIYLIWYILIPSV